ncbi:4-hydroxy-tetrahydrodipicolinate synthase [Candidatus Riesia pediculischaeffi]|uniref:4-hydroxy-tetrahydrodipicolinate synthase n=1 Tax=Candidatus Riesia pediculischaeffi TaxID=428411 RepID=A0A1V0HKS1_9ENTR|nr:4-hydroxy-tetrahydrodipicolinate synthase [Candidatus Riesia pediculischaeffi]ARC53419.1 hypothetical protein AOQ87_02010 [Candidatus Riesia pediculischaeffi]
MKQSSNKVKEKGQKRIFSGSIAAIVTPMNEDGSIDKISLKKVVEYHIKEKTQSIVVCGTTGEFYKLTQKEYMDVIFSAVEYADNKIPIIAGNNSDSTRGAVLTNKLVQKSQIAGHLVNAPFSRILSQEELYAHFKEISYSTDSPQVLYNVPSRTKNNLSLSTIYKLSKIDNIVGIKESHPSLRRIVIMKKLINRRFYILGGNDLNFFQFILNGGDGVISVVANIAANVVRSICDFLLSEKIEKAKKLHYKLHKLIVQLSYFINPIPIKLACHKVGLIRSSFSRIEVDRNDDLEKYHLSLKKFLSKFFKK